MSHKDEAVSIVDNRRFFASLRRKDGRMKAAPKSVGSTRQGLTNSLDRTKERLMTKPTRACGCPSSTVENNHSVKDMTGEVFGKLTVSHRAGSDRWQKALWCCRCECGEYAIVLGELLRSHKTASCGCVKRNVWKIHVTHGQAGPTRRTSMYNRWVLMKRRCGNPRAKDYPRYGGRGISVCPEWVDSFEAFAAYVGECPGPEYSLDRIDNDGNYEPGNVRWATASEQARNKRPRQLFSIPQEVIDKAHERLAQPGMTLNAFAEDVGMSRNTVAKLLRGGTGSPKSIDQITRALGIGGAE